MSHHVYCDRCGAERFGDGVEWVTLEHYGDPAQHVCAECANDLAEWLAVRPAEHEQGHR